MRIGEASAATGVHRSTIRLYESLGFITPPQRTASNYRLFSAEHLLRTSMAAATAVLLSVGAIFEVPFAFGVWSASGILALSVVWNLVLATIFLTLFSTATVLFALHSNQRVLD